MMQFMSNNVLRAAATACTVCELVRNKCRSQGHNMLCGCAIHATVGVYSLSQRSFGARSLWFHQST